MRKPRDIDAELKALSDKARALKAKQRTQLGELVAATGADALDPEILAGILLQGVREAKIAPTREAWRLDGAAFFHRGKRSKPVTSEKPGCRSGRRWPWRYDGQRRRRVGRKRWRRERIGGAGSCNAANAPVT